MEQGWDTHEVSIAFNSIVEIHRELLELGEYGLEIAFNSIVEIPPPAGPASPSPLALSILL